MKPRGVITGIIAGLIFIFIYVFLEMSIMFSLIITFVIFIAANVITKPASDEIEWVTTGLTKREADRIIKEGYGKVSKIKKAAYKINDEEIQKITLEVASAAKDIFVNFEKDPKDIKMARKFLTYYLDTTVKIVIQYVEIEKTSSLSMNETKTKVHSTLVTIRESFIQQLEKLLVDDVMNLDAEIELLVKTLEMESF